MQFLFGAGSVFGIPIQDAYGNAITNGTPIQIGVMQEMSLEFSGDVKELYGQNQFAVDVGRGKAKTGGKIKGAQVSGAAINSLFFGQTMVAGTGMAAYIDSTGIAIPATPFTVTAGATSDATHVMIPNSGTWVEDLGVRDSNGVAMTKVASGPTAGQYMVAAGVYTFAAADTGKQVFINYRYSYTLTTGKQITVNNVQMGAAPLLRVLMQVDYRGKRALVILPNALFTKMTMFSTKLDDYSIPEEDFSCFADSTGNVATIYTSE